MYEVKEKESKKSSNIVIFIIITLILSVVAYIFIGKKNNSKILKEEIKVAEAEIRLKPKEEVKSKVPLDDFTTVEFGKRNFKVPDEYIFTINKGIFKLSIKDSFECKIKIVNKKFSKILSDKKKIKKDIEKDDIKVDSIKEVKYNDEKHLKFEINKNHIILYKKFNNIKSLRIEIKSENKNVEDVYKKKIKKVIDSAK